MVVRVQKSKEDGLDFSLALSFYLLFKISKSEAQEEISGPLSRVAIVFGGKRWVLFSRDKKKRKKKKADE
jgi:hypothetical protein